MVDIAIYCNIHKRSDVDSCQTCEEENPILKRYFVAQIAINHLDLTDGNECSIEDGWRNLEEEINRAIQCSGAGYHRVPFQITFDQWEENPNFLAGGE